jgi:hypothetical protein
MELQFETLFSKIIWNSKICVIKTLEFILFYIIQEDSLVPLLSKQISC